MKIYGVSRTVVYWVLAALVLAFVPSVAEIGILRFFIGGIMIFYGLEEIILTVFKNKKHYSFNTLYWNVIEIVVGFTLIVFVKTGDAEVTYAVVCVCWAIWSILRETHELAEVTEKLKETKLISCKIVAVVNLLESLTVIALSLTMIVEPGEHHAKIHLYLLAVELFTKVLFPAIYYIAERNHEKKLAKSEETTEDRTAPQETEPQESEAEAPLPENSEISE